MVTLTPHTNPAPIDVRVYGATGDGVTDDTTALLAAVAALTSGRSLYLPRGTYLLSDDLLISDLSKLTIYGDGPNQTIIKGGTLWTTAPASGAVPALINIWQTDATGATRNTDITIRDIGFEGFNQGAGVANEPKAISGRFTDRVRIENCQFYNFGHETIWPAGSGTSPCNEWLVSGNTFVSCGVTSSTPNPVTINGDRATVSGNTFRSCYGAVGLSGYWITVSGNAIYDEKFYSFGIGGDGNAGHVTLTGNVVHLESGSAARGGAIVNNDCPNTVLSGNTFHLKSLAGATQAVRGIYITGNPDCAVTGNKFYLDGDTTGSSLYAINAIGDGTNVAVVGNVIRYINLNTAYSAGINIQTSGAGQTVKCLVAANSIIGFTRVNATYAIDLNENAGAGITYTAVGNLSDGGYQRYGAELIGDATADNRPVHRSTTIPSFGAAGLAADVIAEITAAAGVTVDGVKMKDGYVVPSATAGESGAIGVTGGDAYVHDGTAARKMVDAADKDVASGVVGLNVSQQISAASTKFTGSNPTGATTLIASSNTWHKADATTAPFALTLPAASTCSGKIFIIKKSDASANAVTVTRAGADTIDGATTYALSTQYQSVTLISDGSALWMVV